MPAGDDLDLLLDDDLMTPFTPASPGPDANAAAVPSPHPNAAPVPQQPATAPAGPGGKPASPGPPAGKQSATPHGGKSVRARSPGPRGLPVEPDEAGIENLAQFARAVREANLQQEALLVQQRQQQVPGHYSVPPEELPQSPSPYQQLGRRLERVRGRQAAHHEVR